MKIFTADSYDIQTIMDELLDGAGAVRFTGLFSDAQIAEARAIIIDHSNANAAKVTHFQGAAEADGQIALQRRVWNLLAKGDVFSDMAAHPVLMDVIGAFLGTEFVMGSIAANRILPGFPGQEPRVDYHYWDMHAVQTHPTRLNASYPVNCQVTIMLDPFTPQTGATAYMPGTQKHLRYTTEVDNFYDHAERMEGNPGDVVIFFGAAWHCAMPNLSQQDRTAALSSDFMDNASPEIRQLIRLTHPYPEVPDTADAVNAEGRK